MARQSEIISGMTGVLSGTEAELFYGSTLLFSSDAFYIIAKLFWINL